MTERFSGDIRLNKMACNDYSRCPAANGDEDLYILDTPMINETGKLVVYPFGFAPTLHRYRMDIPGELKMGKNIFVGAMSDVFGVWVPDGWIREIMDACMKYPVHNYLFLTKNPQRYEYAQILTLKENIWYGTSITMELELNRISHLPAFCNTFVSMEPLLGDIHPEKYYCLFRSVDWIIIGAETGHRKDKVIPQREWIEKIVLMADEMKIPVFMKESLAPIMGKESMRRVFPEELLKKAMSPKMEKRLYAKCDSCKVHQRKGGMIALHARSKRGEQPKQFCFMCQICFRKFCENLQIVVPTLANLKGDAAIEGNGCGEGDCDG